MGSMWFLSIVGAGQRVCLLFKDDDLSTFFGGGEVSRGTSLKSIFSN